MRSVVLTHDDLPDPFVGKLHFPAWHRGFPWHPFNRETDAAFFNAPEQVAFLEHGDRRGIGEVGRGRIESPGCRTLAVEVSAMTGGTIGGIKTLPLLDGIGSLGNRIGQACIFARWSRMNRAIFPWWLIANSRAVIGLPADKQRKTDQDTPA